MNKPGYQPMPVLLRAESSDARLTSNSAKILRVVAALGTALALSGVAAICLIAFNAFPAKRLEPKPPADVPRVPAPQEPAATTSNPETVPDALPSEKNQSHGGAVVEDSSIADRGTTTAAAQPAAPATVPAPDASVSDKDLLKGESTEADHSNPERHLSETFRKRLEKQRLRAERKRARLEEMYQQHAISSDTYKKGEEKYRGEIEKYRKQMNAGAVPKD